MHLLDCYISWLYLILFLGRKDFYQTVQNIRFFSAILTGCFLRPDIKRFCMTFSIGPDRIWFCLILVSDFFLQ